MVDDGAIETDVVKVDRTHLDEAEQVACNKRPRDESSPGEDAPAEKKLEQSASFQRLPGACVLSQDKREAGPAEGSLQLADEEAGPAKESLEPAEEQTDTLEETESPEPAEEQTDTLEETESPEPAEEQTDTLEEAEGDGNKDDAERLEQQNTSQAGDSKPMSKSALKKLKKKEKLQQRYKEMKTQAKEKRKEARKQKLEAFSALTAEEREAAIERSKDTRKLRYEEDVKKKERLKVSMESGQNLVLDLEFSDIMKGTEFASMSHQVMFSYAANAKASNPVRFTLTGLSGLMKEKLERLSGYEKWMLHKETRTYLDVFADRKKDLVYLTADSQEVVTSFDMSKIYIIGGLVDHNRLKGVTLDKARKQGISTARLPIPEHVKLASSTVLTVNQVVEIVLEFLSCKDWAKALKSVIPPRKIVL